MLDILHGLVIGKRLELAGQADALPQLPEFEGIDHLGQLGLAHQDDLDQFLARGFQVGQQANLFQRFRTEILRLVYHQYGASPSGMSIQQVGVQDIDQQLDTGRVFGILNAQFIAQAGKQFQCSYPRIEYQRNIDIIGQLLQQTAAYSGFSGADFAGELNETATFPNPV